MWQQVRPPDTLTVRGLGEVTIDADDAEEDVIKIEGGDVTLRNVKVTGGDDGIDATGIR